MRKEKERPVFMRGQARGSERTAAGPAPRLTFNPRFVCCSGLTRARSSRWLDLVCSHRAEQGGQLQIPLPTLSELFTLAVQASLICTNHSMAFYSTDSFSISSKRAREPPQLPRSPPRPLEMPPESSAVLPSKSRHYHADALPRQLLHDQTLRRKGARRTWTPRRTCSSRGPSCGRSAQGRRLRRRRLGQGPEEQGAKSQTGGFPSKGMSRARVTHEEKAIPYTDGDAERWQPISAVESKGSKGKGCGEERRRRKKQSDTTDARETP